MKESYRTVTKTLMTMYYEHRREVGHIKKAPQKALFCDGLTRKTRTLWEDDERGEQFVILNGNAHRFEPYPERLQTAPGFIKGHI